MNNPFDDYLGLLGQITENLEHLCGLAKKKSSAVRNSDLSALDEILKQEQASALAFRGLEQKQNVLLRTTGLTDVPLSALAENFPPQKRSAAKEVVEKLQAQYQLYKCCSEVARNTLECNLHEIDKILGRSASVQGPGYQEKPMEIPKPMKTDFRA